MSESVFGARKLSRSGNSLQRLHLVVPAILNWTYSKLHNGLHANVPRETWSLSPSYACIKNRTLLYTFFLPRQIIRITQSVTEYDTGQIQQYPATATSLTHTNYPTPIQLNNCPASGNHTLHHRSVQHESPGEPSWNTDGTQPTNHSVTGRLLQLEL